VEHFKVENLVLFVLQVEVKSEVVSRFVRLSCCGCWFSVGFLGLACWFFDRLRFYQAGTSGSFFFSVVLLVVCNTLIPKVDLINNANNFKQKGCYTYSSIIHSNNK